MINFLQHESGVFIDFYANFDQILLSNKSAWFLGKERDSIYKKVIDSTLKMKAKKWGDINYITLSNMLLGGKLPKFLVLTKDHSLCEAGEQPFIKGRFIEVLGEILVLLRLFD